MKIATVNYPFRLPDINTFSKFSMCKNYKVDLCLKM